VGRVDGKIAMVTGAARGTGERTARLLAAEGARVVLADVLDARGAEVAKAIGATAEYAHLDVTSESDWAAAVEGVLRAHGRIDVLVNNAAVLHMQPLEQTSLADFERVVRVNQTGPFLGMRAVAPAMRAAGRGSIVNVSSIDGMTTKSGLVAYSASKWALRGMTRVAAVELGRYGVRVNAVCPEAGSPEMFGPYVPAGVDPEVAASFSQRILKTQMKRSLAEKMEDVARMIVFLASDESGSCTGADFLVDGGNLAGTRIDLERGKG
jgi:3alpha(or 20beta)-hydroxysteroid dehydrogenase